MFLELKALIHNFVKGIEVVGAEAGLTYTIPMHSDGRIREEASVLDSCPVRSTTLDKIKNLHHYLHSGAVGIPLWE